MRSYKKFPAKMASFVVSLSLVFGMIPAAALAQGAEPAEGAFQQATEETDGLEGQNPSESDTADVPIATEGEDDADSASEGASDSPSEDAPEGASGKAEDDDSRNEAKEADRQSEAAPSVFDSVETTPIQGEYVPGEVIVVYKDQSVEMGQAVSPEGSDEQTTLEDLGVQEQKVVVEDEAESGDVSVVSLDEDTSVEEAIAKLELLPEVAYAEPNYIYETDAVAPNDPMFGDQYYLTLGKFTDAWGVTNGGRKVTVAVVDTGCNLQHPDLKANLRSDLAMYYLPGTTSGSVRSGSLASGGFGNNGDEIGHGTNVTGLIAAQANNGVGIAGTAYNNAQVIPIKTVYKNEVDKNVTNALLLIEALDYIDRLVESNPSLNLRVVNLSIGGEEGNDALHAKIKHLKQAHDLLIVCSGGNKNNSLPNYPADYDECVSVASTDMYGNSSTWCNQNMYKDISAPGEGIVTTTNTGGYTQEPTTRIKGTSFSSPIVAGAAALIYSQYPNLGSNELVNAMKSSATPLKNKPSNSGSAGMLNVMGAMSKLGASTAGTPTLTTSVSSDLATATVTATGGAFSGASAVSFATWSNTGGQDDLVWYQARRSGNSWVYSIPVSNHRTAGDYTVHAYATTQGASKFVKAATFRINVPAATRMTIQTTNAATGAFKVSVAGLSTSLVSKVQIPVWSSAGGQDDIVWYNATHEGNGNWAVYTSIASHRLTTGTYIAHAYVTCKNGIYGAAGTAQGTVTLAGGTVRAALTSDQRAVWLFASGGNFAYASSVSLPLWSAAGGQNDLVWYQAYRTSNGWEAKVDLTRHATAGTYYVDGYARVGGVNRHAGSATFTVAAPKAAVKVARVDGATGSVVVDVTVSNAPSGVAWVDVPFWFDQGGQDDLVWHRATRVSGNTFRVQTSMQSHRYQTGRFNAHAYVRTGNGIYAGAGAGAGTLAITPARVAAAVSADQRVMWISATGGYFAFAGSVSLPVWSAAGGQDDLVWYQAYRTSKGWEARVDIARHATAGIYFVDGYANVGGVSRYAGGAKCTVSAPSSSVKVTKADGSTGAIIIEVTVSRAPSGVSWVDVPVWFDQGGQDDLVWHRATRVSGNTFRVQTSAQAHRSQTGRLNAHAYVKCGNGVYAYAGAGAGTLKTAPAKLSVYVTPDHRTAWIFASGGNFALASSVQFPTWSVRGGQDDLVWHQAYRTAYGWEARVDLSSHGYTGPYKVDGYATSGGVMRYSGGTTFK